MLDEVKVRERKSAKHGKTYEYPFEIAQVGGERKWISNGGFLTQKEAKKAGLEAWKKYCLDKLWRGDITPSERYIRPDSEFKRKAKEFCDAAERLVEGLSPEGKNHWEDVERLKHDMNMLSEEDIFIYGFRMGARMILDVVCDHKQIGRPQVTADDVPSGFLRHYPTYKRGQLNVSELARVCNISRTTAYKYISLLEH